MAHRTISHTAEFKQEAVRLVISSGKSCAQIARDLGVAPHLVVRWKKLHDQHTAAGRPVFTGRGVAALSDQEARTKQLERELEITRQERDILKKHWPSSPDSPDLRLRPAAHRSVLRGIDV